jgi:hypothetical protein
LGESHSKEIEGDDVVARAAPSPLLRGQTFDQNQQLDKANEVNISESFARQYFGDEDPLGKHLVTPGNRAFEIVGIVGDTTSSSGLCWRWTKRAT